MILRHLLDTNVAIEFVRGNPRIQHRIQTAPIGSLALPFTAVAELHYGVHRAPRPERPRSALAELLQIIPIFHSTPEALETYGRIKADLAVKGNLIEDNDLFIAASALAAGLTLVTSNLRHFRRIPGLRLEDWTAD